jgi:pimeloyl-ACP methyl ester carboxylesterase
VAHAARRAVVHRYAIRADSYRRYRLGRAGVAVLVALGVGRAAVVGHHTGAAIAVEIAAAYPEHVAALVLSASPYVDEARRLEAKEMGHVIDHAVPRIDGGISPNSGRCGSLFIRPTVLISWNGSSSMPLRQAPVLRRGIASLIAMKWKRAYR